ncbi:CYTH domain-containing protein [Enterococcus sp.]|uniref:CYTH domain-containing protein n=1 Tax=Enterococcus sp. TaxID=35783 RepID=UPI00290B8E66|nr:CYTH domain-containing protein [Enterococcus sp.]MDU5334389.1 CYTH domain-containing protein [Enterococcus sp.]
MSKEIEIEFKSMLTKKEYETLLRYYNVSDEQFVTQTNLYFDTTDFQLKQHGMGLRIRRFADKAEATLKIPQTIGLLEVTDPLTLNEVDEALAKDQFAQQAAEILEQLETLNIPLSDLHLIGKLITNRAEFMISEGKLALDESWYSEHHDFELELEVPNSGFDETAFKQLLAKFDLPYRKTQNKIVRAVSAQQEQNKEMEGL